MNRSAQRGLALVVVLWVLVLLSLVAASFTRTTRTEVNVARNLVDNAKAEAMAEAGVYLAVLALLDPDPARRPRRDGTPWKVAFAGARITVSVQDEGGKIDLNQAPDALLRGLLLAAAWTGPEGEAAGLDAAEADALVDAIRDFADPDDLHRLHGAEDRDYEAAGIPWGAKDAPFEAVEELQQVIGMTANLYRQVAPALTVYSGQRGIRAAVAPSAVLRALPGITDGTIDVLLAARATAATATVAASEPDIAEDSPSPESSSDPPAAEAGPAALQDLLSRPGLADVGLQELFTTPPAVAADETGATTSSEDDEANEAELERAGVERRYLSRSRRQVYTLRAEAHARNGAVFVREGVVRLTGSADRRFRFLAWRQGTRSARETEQND